MTNMHHPCASMTAFAMRRAVEGQDPSAAPKNQEPPVDLSQIPITPEDVQANLKKNGYGSMAEPTASMTALAQQLAKEEEASQKTK